MRFVVASILLATLASELFVPSQSIWDALPRAGVVLLVLAIVGVSKQRHRWIFG